MLSRHCKHLLVVVYKCMSRMIGSIPQRSDYYKYHDMNKYRYTNIYYNYCVILIHDNVMHYTYKYVILININTNRLHPHLTDMRFCYSGLQSEGPPRHEHDSDTKRGVASAMKPPDKKIGSIPIITN